MIFGTEGKGHYDLTLWRVIDVLLANMFANVAISMLLWKMGLITLGNIFTHTLATSNVWYALYDMLIYTLLLLNGGGVTDNIAVAEGARIILALQLLSNSVVILIIFAASVATLQMHTDEGMKRKKEQALKAKRRQTKRKDTL